MNAGRVVEYLYHIAFPFSPIQLLQHCLRPLPHLCRFPGRMASSSLTMASLSPLGRLSNTSLTPPSLSSSLSSTPLAPPSTQPSSRPTRSLLALRLPSPATTPTVTGPSSLPTSRSLTRTSRPPSSSTLRTRPFPGLTVQLLSLILTLCPPPPLSLSSVGASRLPTSRLTQPHGWRESAYSRLVGFGLELFFNPVWYSHILVSSQGRTSQKECRCCRIGMMRWHFVVI